MKGVAHLSYTSHANIEINLLLLVVRISTHLRMNTYQANFLTFLGEKPNEQISWVKNLNIDEVMPWEVRNLCYLMNAILLQAVDKEVNGSIAFNFPVKIMSCSKKKCKQQI